MPALAATDAATTADNLRHRCPQLCGTQLMLSQAQAESLTHGEAKADTSGTPYLYCSAGLAKAELCTTASSGSFSIYFRLFGVMTSASLTNTMCRRNLRSSFKAGTACDRMAHMHACARAHNMAKPGRSKAAVILGMPRNRNAMLCLLHSNWVARQSGVIIPQHGNTRYVMWW